MITFSEINQRVNQHKTVLYARYGIKRLGVFGSCVRGDNHEGSDVDILVEFEQSAGIEFIDLADELEDLIGERVDLVSAGGLKPDYYSAIKKDLIYV
jgi:predicted nucleotidyltransferase